MRFSLNHLSSLALLLGLTLSAHAAPKFVIVTEGTPGFREGEKFYRVGMSGADFVKQFGPPDRKVGTSNLVYAGDGITAYLNKDGTIAYFGFYFERTPFRGENLEYSAADAATDKGVTKGDSTRAVVKAQGEPLETKDIEVLNETWLIYKWGDVSMKDGRLHKVTVGKLKN